MNFRHTLPVFAVILLPLAARADRPPDFESDAKPLIERQPGLLAYIHKHFEVKETGLAASGNGDQAPRPPFIFSARPKGHSGPFYLRLLIQPGPPGQILKVADIRKLPPGAMPPEGNTQPEIGSSAPQQAPPQEPPQEPPSGQSQPASPAETPASPTSSTPSSGPTASTPSGPIHD